ncbi:MAG: triose-phosphate isomerase family protein, partial [Pseudonocardiaceae bacterium]
MPRQPLIAGNWKMNLSHLEAIALVQKLAFALPEKYLAKVEVAVLVPFTAIRSVQALVEGDKLLVGYGAQDLAPKDSGPYTGDVSGPMLAKLDCSYVVVGHSERREHHGEDDGIVASKVRAALRNGLIPILCVGEGLEVRESGGHLAHSTEQLRAALKGLSAEQVRTIVVAYEPIWAIGTGRVAT